jgi:hypothetical protein
MFLAGTPCCLSPVTIVVVNVVVTGSAPSDLTWEPFIFAWPLAFDHIPTFETRSRQILVAGGLVADSNTFAAGSSSFAGSSFAGSTYAGSIVPMRVITRWGYMGALVASENWPHHLASYLRVRHRYNGFNGVSVNVQVCKYAALYK